MSTARNVAKGTRRLKCCCLCGLPVGPSKRMKLMLSDPTDGTEIHVYWHMRHDGDCADKDERHQVLADAIGVMGPDGDIATCVAYLGLRDAVLERHGVLGLRACIDIRADFSDGKRTLRGPGAAWGKLARRRAT